MHVHRRGFVRVADLLALESAMGGDSAVGELRADLLQARCKGFNLLLLAVRSPLPASGN